MSQMVEKWGLKIPSKFCPPQFRLWVLAYSRPLVSAGYWLHEPPWISKWRRKSVDTQVPDEKWRSRKNTVGLPHPRARFASSREVRILALGSHPRTRFEFSRELHILALGSHPRTRFASAHEVRILARASHPRARFASAHEVHIRARGSHPRTRFASAHEVRIRARGLHLRIQPTADVKPTVTAGKLYIILQGYYRCD